MKMKKYIDNLISAHYDEYNLTIYLILSNTIVKRTYVEIKNMYPDENLFYQKITVLILGVFFIY